MNTALEDSGFGPQLLCSLVGFRDAERRPLALVYLYKRGTFYPFAPLPGGRSATTRWNSRSRPRSRTTCASSRT